MLSLLPHLLTLATAVAGEIFHNVTVFEPPSEWVSHNTSYARTVLLEHGRRHLEDPVLLSTWSFWPPEGPYLPIYRSINGGRSWSDYSRVYFTHRNYTGGNIWQPFLYELPQRVGEYPQGTILASGNAIPEDASSTNIELYASLDRGFSWEFVSVVATGGPPNTTNGATPVWEPFISMYKDILTVYYSDQRDPLHGQKLAHQSTQDLIHWGPIINDAADANYTLRPGMTTIAQLGNGKYILSYELANSQETDYAVHYRIADSPLEFDRARPHLLRSQDGTIPSACPYTVWTPIGGPHGTIVLSDGTHTEVFINRENGDPRAWLKVPTDHGVAYSRSLTVLPDPNIILFFNGGRYNESETAVTAGEWIVPRHI
ncbi:BNR/Asp-box repeat domain protein [Aspergillus lucknowensis]|uniref:BNR/Asp-box repeat domain protein n=1 Tax=Aspergillus lucknowensis TaxID=176173 RepID=A0ABR4LS60_9EURO